MQDKGELKMYKKFCSILLVVLLLSCCFIFTSCSNENNIEEPTQNNIIMLEDVMGNDGVYCLHSDGSVTKADSLSASNIEELWLYDGAEPLIIDRETDDKLIYIGDIVTTYGDMYEMDSLVEKYYWSGTILDFEEIAEIEGIDVNGVCEFAPSVQLALDDYLTPLGLVAFGHPLGTRYSGEGILASKNKCEYTYGYYEGTTWMEKTDKCYIPYYEQISHGTEETDWEYVFESPIIKGKDGYFTIELSDVESGLYIGEFDKIDSHFVFEIK